MSNELCHGEMTPEEQALYKMQHVYCDERIRQRDAEIADLRQQLDAREGELAREREARVALEQAECECPDSSSGRHCDHAECWHECCECGTKTDQAWGRAKRRIEQLEMKLKAANEAKETKNGTIQAETSRTIAGTGDSAGPSSQGTGQDAVVSVEAKEGGLVLFAGLLPVCQHCFKPRTNCDCDAPFEPLCAQSAETALQEARRDLGRRLASAGIEAWRQGYTEVEIVAGDGERTTRNIIEAVQAREQQCAAALEADLRGVRAQLADKQRQIEGLRSALETEAARWCGLCADTDKVTDYQAIFERATHRGPDGRFFHRRHDGTGAWPCASQAIAAAMAAADGKEGAEDAE